MILITLVGFVSLAVLPNEILATNREVHRKPFAIERYDAIEIESHDEFLRQGLSVSELEDAVLGCVRESVRFFDARISVTEEKMTLTARLGNKSKLAIADTYVKMSGEFFERYDLETSAWIEISPPIENQEFRNIILSVDRPLEIEVGSYPVQIEVRDVADGHSDFVVLELFHSRWNRVSNFESLSSAVDDLCE